MTTNFHQPDPRRRGNGDGNDGGSSGSGDMTKAVYDTNNNGRVDYTDKVFGVDTATVSQYYGTNGAGVIGFHDLPAGGGASVFTDLTDTPADYTGFAGYGVRVNVGETGLEFYEITGGGGGADLDAQLLIWQGI